MSEQRDFPDERPASATAERVAPARVPNVRPDSPLSPHPLARLREPGTVRARCHAILRAVLHEVSSHFKVDLSRLDEAAERVARLTRARFPDGVIPLHSRWRHFEAGGIDRKTELDQLLDGRPRDEVARAHIDLTVVSVLLDAGAGAAWKYTESAPDGSTRAYSRSEGLAVASFRAFVAGRFSADPADPCRADAAVLARVDGSVLRPLFQASPSNPLVGLDGRAGLIARLGSALQSEAARDGSPARPGLLWDRLKARGMHGSTIGGTVDSTTGSTDGSTDGSTGGGTAGNITAAEVLGEVLANMAPIWTSGSTVQGLAGGDVWPHLWAGAATGRGDDTTTAGWVPFHKLSQWLTYSLVEPLQWAGMQVTGLDELTGLPEYRNGGLLLDCGVIVPRRATDLARSWKPGDEFIVEWRALTVALLDLLAERVRARLGKSAAQLPLACILEGGTWAAGREIAHELRPDGAPPLKIDSDGTVF